MHEDPNPAELFIRVRGIDCTSEVVGACMTSSVGSPLSRYTGAPLEKVGEMLLGLKFEWLGGVSLHPRIKYCTSLPDLIGRHVLVEHCNRP